LFLSVDGDTIERMFEGCASPSALVWHAASPDALLDELLVDRPGPWMLGVLDGVRDEVVTDSAREKYLVCWDRFMSWAQLQRARAVVGAATSQSMVVGPFGADDFGSDVVALLTGSTTVTAANELGVARSIVTELNGCFSALDAGEISWQMAREVADQTERLTAWQRELVDQAMVNSWEIDRDITQWRRKLRREVLKVDEDSEARRQRAIAERNVATWPLPDGMAAVHAELRSEDAAIVMAALTAIADKYREQDRAAAASADEGRSDAVADDAHDGAAEWVDPESFNCVPDAVAGRRTMDQRRADALVDVCADVLTDPTLPKRQGRRPTVQVTGGILTLLGLRNDPGELAGYGPITAEHLREIAADGDWHRFCTAPDTGTLISIGTATYRPKQALRDFMVAAEPSCDFTGCCIPSRRTDAEHTLAHHDGGDTDEDNVRPRCRRHHRCKTHAGWLVARLPDGTTRWTTPAGTHRIITPHRLAGDDNEDGDGDSDDSR
jgi:hypothetical protein